MLLKGANAVITNNGKFEYLENSYIGIDDKTIDYIGQEAPKKDYGAVKDMRGKILIPGLVNTHGHSAMVLLRGLGSDLPLHQWLATVNPIEDRLREEDILSGMELAILEMLKCGTTSFCDMYLKPFAALKAIDESGIKANICRCLTCLDKDQDPRTYAPILESIDLFRSYNKAFDDRLHIDFSMHAEYTICENIARYYSEVCKKEGGRMHIHLSETQREHKTCIEKYGMTPAAWFNSLGTFDSPTYAAHCVWVTDDDIAIFKEKNVSVMHNPSSNMKLASGFAPVAKMLEEGINVTIGTDGAASNNNLDMLEEMHLTSIIHNGYMLNPTVMSPDTVLKMATANGAKLQGRNDTGSLEVGKKADIVAIDTSSPHCHPILNPLALLTYSIGEEDVYMTMVDGKILYENGEFLTLDKERIYHDVDKSIKYLFG